MKSLATEVPRPPHPRRAIVSVEFVVAERAVAGLVSIAAPVAAAEVLKNSRLPIDWTVFDIVSSYQFINRWLVLLLET